MEFFNAAVDVMKTVVVALGGGVALIGITLVPQLANLFG